MENTYGDGSLGRWTCGGGANLVHFITFYIGIIIRGRKGRYTLIDANSKRTNKFIQTL
jgi:hypothetical protein